MYYHNFDITIDNAGLDGYPIRASCELSGEGRSILALAPGSHDLLDELHALEGLNTDMESLVVLGKMLYQGLFTGEVGVIFQQSLGAVQRQNGTGLRIRLMINAPELAALPWEAMYLPNERCFIGTSIKTPLVRYQELPQAVTNLTVSLPFRMLVVIPDSISPFPEIDAETEKQNLLKALKAIAGHIEVTWLEGRVTWEALSDQLTENEFNCFHFIGHGVFHNGRGALVLQDDKGGADYADESRIASVFKNLPAMKLVVLNACNGASVSTSRVLSGLAPTLVVSGIPAVVAMKYAIADEAAVLFARRFYRSLFLGGDSGRIDIAMAQARSHLSGEVQNARDFCTPVLYLRSRQGVLFETITHGTLPNIPWTRNARDGARAIYETYREQHQLTGDAGAAVRMEHIRRLDLLRRRGQLIATGTVIVLFLFSWVGLFDILGLDTRAEMYTVRVGELFTEVPFHEKIMTVMTQEEIDKEWRRTRHPVLLDKLSMAGAKVIAFDLVFAEPSAYDPPFVQAIERAKARGTKILAGIGAVKEQKERIAPVIAAALSAPGCNVCVGRKLDCTRSIPLAILKTDPGGRVQGYFSLSLAAYAAYMGEDPRASPSVDLIHRQILLTTRNGSVSIPFAETIRAKFSDRCDSIDPGDTVCDMIIMPTSLGALRAPSRHISYEEVLIRSVEQLKPDFSGKIVLVGGSGEDRFRENRLQPETRCGVELHAEALNSLLNEVSIRPLASIWQLIIILVMGFLGGFIRGRLYNRTSIARGVAAIGSLALFLGTVVLLYGGYYLLINILYPIAAFWLSYYFIGKIDRRITP